jgi:hypothetical protein
MKNPQIDAILRFVPSDHAASSVIHVFVASSTPLGPEHTNQSNTK